MNRFNQHGPARDLLSRALVGILALGLSANAAVGQRNVGRETTRVIEIEVPIQVSAKGAPIRGLTKDDFEILDGRKKVDVLGFEVVDLNDIQEAEADLPLAARRHFLAFFDLTFSDPNSIQRARDAAAHAVLSSLHAADLVGVATYSPRQGLNLVLGFTSDRNQVRAAIRTLGLLAPEEIKPDPLGLIVAEIDSLSQTSSGAQGPAGFDAQAELTQALGELATLRRRSSRGEAETRIAQVMDGLGTVAQLMDSIRGRKHVLYMSEGFDSRLLFGDSSIEAQQRIALAVEEGRTQDIDNDDRFGSSDGRRVVDRALEVFRRTNATIQAIDIGGLTAGRKNQNLDSLRYLARGTGGETFANFNNLGEAMGQMLEKTSVTYLLTFAPSSSKQDGKFREITVKVKNVPRGADISHRTGYFLPRAYSDRSGIEKQLITAQEVVAGRVGGDLRTHVIAPAFLVAGARAYVPVLIEIDGKSLLDGHQGDVLPVEIYAYALDPQGTVRGYFSRNLGFDLAQAGDALNTKGVKYWGHVDLDPGSYTLRVLARNSTTGARGVAVATIDVPDSTTAKSVLLPPLFAEPPGIWALAREDASEQRQVDYPFISKGQPFIPAAHPPVPSNGETTMNLMGYNLGAGSLSATGVLVDHGGQVVDGVEVRLDADTRASDGVSCSLASVCELRAVLKTQAVPTGDYTLLVTLNNAGNNVEETNSVRLRITG